MHEYWLIKCISVIIVSSKFNFYKIQKSVKFSLVHKDEMQQIDQGQVLGFYYFVRIISKTIGIIFPWLYVSPSDITYNISLKWETVH